jgi:hypothetical protein
MSQITALENLLQQAGYGKRRAAKLAEVIDAAAIPGMSGDDLYVAFLRWKQVAGLTDSAVKLMTADSFTQTQQYDKLRTVMLEMLEDVKNGQQYLGFVPLVDSSKIKGPPNRVAPSLPAAN